MPGGLFELRRDDITGWWVAVVVERAYDRSRFAQRAEPVLPEGAVCQNCARATTDGVWLRMLREQAFTIAGSQREFEASGRDERDPEQPGLGLMGDVGSWATIAAPVGHHERLDAADRSTVIAMLALARDAVRRGREQPGIDYVQVVQNAGRQAGARTDHLCIDIYDLPQIPHRLGEELGGAARYLIREGVCPWCRLVREEVARRDRLVYQDASTVCFAPWASRSPFELWVVPRHHEADFGRATDEQLEGAADALQGVLRALGVLDDPPYNLVLHTAPAKERVDETYHWHWELHPRLREIAGLELGTGLPVNPVSPEEAVLELRRQDGRAAARLEMAAEDGPRDWDDFPRG
jgi:UDPglucose--hexose-1-phosphate uridylyltransferase